MYRNIPMSMPTEIAVGKSAKIVTREVAPHEAASNRWAFIKRGISCHVVMLKTLDRIRADTTGNGMNRTTGVARSRKTTRKTACRMPPMGVWAPRRTFSSV